MSVDEGVLPSRYANAQRIARGGMGDIYLAEDRQLGRKVAVKVLAERFASDQEVRERFKREALTAARLSGHPHIVAIFDVGDTDGQPFIVMEYLAGGTVAERARRERIPRAQALDWLEQAADALDAAHREGIVHRDVKPANMLFDARGELKVVDFGIARVLDQTTAGMTAPGTVLGTAGYLSPEQASGEEATPASDIYGLGVVAYELLTGGRPFERGSATAEAAAHIHEPVPAASDRGPGVPRAVDAVFERALAKEPDERHASAGELVEDLRAALTVGEQETGRVTVPPTAATVPVGRAAGAPPPRRRSWLLPAILAVLLLGGGGALAAVIASDDDDRRTATQVVTQRETVTQPGTISVRTEVQTVTTEIAEEEPPPPPEPTPGPPPPPPANVETTSDSEGIRLTDQNKYANDRGDYQAGLRYGEQAVAVLQGSGLRYEAYAYYNYGVSLMRTGRCDEALEYFNRSEQIQGYRSEIARARAEAQRCARGRTSDASDESDG